MLVFAVARGVPNLPAPIGLNSARIHRIIEQEGAFFDALRFFPTLTQSMLDENRYWLQPRFIDATGKLLLCVQSYLIQTPHHNILVDTCVGNDKPRPTRAFWHMLSSDRYQKNLAAAGLSVADIDFVLCTHLHIDHVGWNTRLENGRWVPTFPNARYLFAQRELAYWVERQRADAAAYPWVEDSVLPILDRGQADVVDSSHALDDTIRLLPTPGHTIDHFCVQIGRSDPEAIISGDMIHSPLQARFPELGMMADYDSRQAEQSRRALFGRICDRPTLLCTAHFPTPSVGRIVRWHETFDFVPAEQI